MGLFFLNSCTISINWLKLYHHNKPNPPSCFFVFDLLLEEYCSFQKLLNVQECGISVFHLLNGTRKYISMKFVKITNSWEDASARGRRVQEVNQLWEGRLLRVEYQMQTPAITVQKVNRELATLHKIQMLASFSNHKFQTLCFCETKDYYSAHDLLF